MPYNTLKLLLFAVMLLLSVDLKAQKADKKEYELGSIILPGKVIKEGLIRFEKDVLVFKDSVNAPRQLFKMSDMEGYVLNEDTFAVAHNIVLSSGLLGKRVGDLYVKQARYGNVYLYVHKVISTGGGGFMMGGGGTMMMTPGSPESEKDYYYLRRKNETEFTTVPQGKSEFKEMMATYLADFPELCKDIQDGKVGYKETGSIISMYNSKRK